MHSFIPNFYNESCGLRAVELVTVPEICLTVLVHSNDSAGRELAFIILRHLGGYKNGNRSTQNYHRRLDYTRSRDKR
jgi:hypothetical protein